MIPLGFTAFVLFGGILVLIGTNQAALADSLGLDLADTGLLGASLSLGIGVGVLVAGPLVDRYARRPIFLASILLTGIAVISVDREMSFSRALVHMALMGVGGGAYDTLLNAVTVERYREASSRPLSLLHSGAAVGAVVAPPLIAALAVAGDWTWSFRALGAAYLLLAVWVALVPLDAPASRVRDTDAPHEERSQLFSRAVCALCVVGFAYVGVEGALTLFAVPYATGALALDGARGQSAISVFWLGLLVGRVALAVYRGPASAGLLAAMGLGGALLVGGGVALGLPAIEIWVLTVGVALGGVFPLMISLVGSAVPHAPGTASGLVMGCGAFGGFAVPWLAGVIGDQAGVAVGVGSLALFAALIFVGALAVRPAPAR